MTLQNDVSMFGPLTANLTLRVNSTDRVSCGQLHNRERLLQLLSIVCLFLYCCQIYDHEIALMKNLMFLPMVLDVS